MRRLPLLSALLIGSICADFMPEHLLYSSTQVYGSWNGVHCVLVS